MTLQLYFCHVHKLLLTLWAGVFSLKRAYPQTACHVLACRLSREQTLGRREAGTAKGKGHWGLGLGHTPGPESYPWRSPRKLLSGEAERSPLPWVRHLDPASSSAYLGALSLCSFDNPLNKTVSPDTNPKVLCGCRHACCQARHLHLPQPVSETRSC